MLRGVASMAVVPSSPEQHASIGSSPKLSVSADWLTRKNSNLSIISGQSGTLRSGGGPPGGGGSGGGHSLPFRLDSHYYSTDNDDDARSRFGSMDSSSRPGSPEISALDAANNEAAAAAAHDENYDLLEPLQKDEDKKKENPPMKLSVPREWLQMVFARMDKDNSGDVNRAEFIQGMRTDPDVCQLFELNKEDESSTTFQDIFDSIDDDGSAEITFDEFAAFFEPRKEGQFYSGDQIEALYEPEGMWYVAKVIKGIASTTATTATTNNIFTTMINNSSAAQLHFSDDDDDDDDHHQSNRSPSPLPTEAATTGSLAAGSTDESSPTMEAYMVRYIEYPDEGPFRVLASTVRPRFNVGDRVRVLLGEHTFLATGSPSIVIKKTDKGYVIRLVSDFVSDESSKNATSDVEEHEVFASDVFPPE